jgi:DNA-binding LacI/PurR family transcriptional regulator
LVDVLDEGPYQWAVLKGAVDASRDRGANLLCFAGGVLGGPHPTDGRSSVFELARPSNVDAVVVVSGSIGKRIGPRGLQAFCDRLRPTPVCSIGVELDGLSSVRIDNETGMRSALEHLVTDHGVSRMAFLRGPEGNPEAEQRYRVYLQTLQRSGLRPSAELVVSGDFERSSGRDAVRRLLVERGLSVEKGAAIVAANDCMALGALDELAARRVRVPDEIAVVGFDDVEESRYSLPPLTTVRQPAYELGYDAVRAVVAQLRNGEPPEHVVRHTEPVIRRSCGCAGPAPFASLVPHDPAPALGFEASLIRRRQTILAEMSRAARGQLVGAGVDWAERVLSSFVDEMHGQSPNAFLRTYEDLLQGLMAKGGDPSVANEVVSALRTRILRCLASSSERRAHAEELFHRARIMTFHVTDRARARLRMRAWTSARAVGRAAAAIASGSGLDDLARAASENLPALGIPRWLVAEYSEADGKAARAQLLLLEAPGAAEVDARHTTTSYPVVDLLRRVVPTEGGHVFAVLPVNHHEEALGVVVLELGTAEGYLYETLREVFTSALCRRRGSHTSFGSAPA